VFARPYEFSPDGLRIVTGSDDKSARVWDAATGREIITLRGHESGGLIVAFERAGGVLSVGFSPDGLRIVTGSRDKTARVWDAATGREIVVLSGHESWVSSAAFSPDSTRVVTGSRDETARVWDVRLAAMAAERLIVEACTRRLGALTLLTRDEMRLIGEPDSRPLIDVCTDVE
jgi:WD40 repeat protein